MRIASSTAFRTKAPAVRNVRHSAVFGNSISKATQPTFGNGWETVKTAGEVVLVVLLFINVFGGGKGKGGGPKGGNGGGNGNNGGGRGTWSWGLLPAHTNSTGSAPPRRR